MGLGSLKKHEVESCEKRHSMSVTSWESLGASPSMIPKVICETVTEVMDTETEGGDEIHPSERQRVAERVLMHVPLVVEPRNHYDVNEFFWSSPIPGVVSVFWRLRDTPKSGNTPSI